MWFRTTYNFAEARRLPPRQGLIGQSQRKLGGSRPGTPHPTEVSRFFARLVFSEFSRDWFSRFFARLVLKPQGGFTFY